MKKVIEIMTERKTEILELAQVIFVLAIFFGLAILTVRIAKRETWRSDETTTIEEGENMTCKECIHYDACKDIFKEFDVYDEIKAMDEDEHVNCKQFEAKHLFVWLPCKVGDTVYRIIGMQIYDCVVAEITLRKGYTFFGCWGGGTNDLEDFGKTIFLTREEAEKKLEEMKKEWYR